MSHQAPRITTPPSISLSLPPSTSTQLSITLSASHYTFLYPTPSKLPTITRTMQAAAFSLRARPDSCSVSTSIRRVRHYHSTSGPRPLCYSPLHLPTSLDLSLLSLSPLLTSPCPPMNQWVIEFSTVVHRRK